MLIHPGHPRCRWGIHRCEWEAVAVARSQVEAAILVVTRRRQQSGEWAREAQEEGSRQGEAAVRGSCLPQLGPLMVSNRWAVPMVV